MRSLDIKKIEHRISGTIDTETALKDIRPIDWPEEVLEGKKQIVVTDLQTEGGSCAKLEISLS